MRKFHYFGLLTAFITTLFLFACQEKELDNIVNTQELAKKPERYVPVDERINTGTQLDCESGYVPVEFTLWAGKYNDAGTVTISNNDNTLFVTFTTNETADLGDVHVYVWTDATDVPLRKPFHKKHARRKRHSKRPVPGHADYVEKDINANEFTVEIPLTEEIKCDAPPTFYIAAHASLVEDSNNPGGSTNAGEGAYGGDDPAIPGSDRGAWFYVDKYTVTCCGDVPLAEVCETAFAFGEQCFLEPDSDNWGWINGPINVEVSEAGCKLMIDDMSVGGVYLGSIQDGYVPVPSGSSGSVTITGDPSLILGGQRDVTLNKNSGNNYFPSVYSETDKWGDVIVYDSFGDRNITWILTYGEAGDLNANFTIGNSDRIRLNAFGELDANHDNLPDVDGDGMVDDGTPLTITIWSGVNTPNVTSYSVTKLLAGEGIIWNSFAGTFDFMFSDFTGIDFTDVDKIVFEFEQIAYQNTSADYGIGTICVYGDSQTLPTTTTTPIYAGAEQCDFTNGTLVGSLTVDYDGSTAVVTYNMHAGYTMDEVQLYVGNEILTVTPEDYPNRDDTLDGVSTYTFTVDGLSGEIYIVAKALVCGDYPE